MRHAEARPRRRSLCLMAPRVLTGIGLHALAQGALASVSLNSHVHIAQMHPVVAQHPKHRPQQCRFDVHLQGLGECSRYTPNKTCALTLRSLDKEDRGQLACKHLALLSWLERNVEADSPDALCTPKAW
jgi:hypothetical protein